MILLAVRIYVDFLLSQRVNPEAVTFLASQRESTLYSLPGMNLKGVDKKFIILIRLPLASAMISILFPFPLRVGLCWS